MSNNNEDVVLVAGTRVEHQRIVNGIEIWYDVPGILKFGGVGDTSDPKEKTTISNLIKKYGSGLRDAPDKTVEGQYIPYTVAGETYYDDFVNQQDFISRCQNEEEFILRVIWPDGEANSYLFKALGFEFPESDGGDWKMFKISGKQNSRALLGLQPAIVNANIASGGSATAPSYITKPSGLENETGETTYYSSDTDVLTVNESTGAISAVGNSGDVASIFIQFRGANGRVTYTLT